MFTEEAWGTWIVAAEKNKKKTEEGLESQPRKGGEGGEMQERNGNS